MLGVQVSYSEEQVITLSSESCLWSRKGLWEALTGAGAGWVLSRETLPSGVPMFRAERGLHPPGTCRQIKVLSRGQVAAVPLAKHRQQLRATFAAILQGYSPRLA